MSYLKQQINPIEEMKTKRAFDQFGIPMKKGDKILVYGVNSMKLETVLICYDDSVIVDGGDVHKYNSRKCVIVTNQIEYNEKEFPECLI